MSLIKGLRDKPSRLTVASKYTALNGIGYLVVGTIINCLAGCNPDGV
jgi:hypothetical protein